MGQCDAAPARIVMQFHLLYNLVLAHYLIIGATWFCCSTRATPPVGLFELTVPRSRFPGRVGAAGKRKRSRSGRGVRASLMTTSLLPRHHRDTQLRFQHPRHATRSALAWPPLARTPPHGALRQRFFFFTGRPGHWPLRTQAALRVRTTMHTVTRCITPSPLQQGFLTLQDGLWTTATDDNIG